MIIGEKVFVVEEVELRLATWMSGKTGGTIPKEQLIGSPYVGCSLVDYLIDPFRAVVTCYSVIILHNDVPFYTEVIKGSVFSDGLKKAIKKSNKNDQIIVYNIKVEPPPNCKYCTKKFPPMSFIIE
jgi:hypothetical protein